MSTAFEQSKRNILLSLNDENNIGSINAKHFDPDFFAQAFQRQVRNISESAQIEAIDLKIIYDNMRFFDHENKVLQPEINTFKDALCISPRPALYDLNNGEIIPESVLYRLLQKKAKLSNKIKPNGIKRLKCSIDHSIEEAYFIPFFPTNHFGHFITETASYLWFITKNKGLNFQSIPIILSDHLAFADNDLFQCFFKLLSYYGFRPILRSQLPRLVKIKTVHIPDPSLRLLSHNSTVYINTCISLGEWITSYCSATKIYENSNIYISRSRLKPAFRKVAGEAALEDELVKLGWKIIYPENLLFSEQVQIYKSAKNICGFEGSALHALSFCKNDQMKIIILGKQPPPDYFMQFYAQKASGYFISCTTKEKENLQNGKILDRDLHEHLIVEADMLANRIHLACKTTT